MQNPFSGLDSPSERCRNGSERLTGRVGSSRLQQRSGSEPPTPGTYPPAARWTRGPQLKGLLVFVLVPVPAKLAVPVVPVQKSEASTAAEEPPQSPRERHPGGRAAGGWVGG